MQREMTVREELEGLATLQTLYVVGLNGPLGARLRQARRAWGHDRFSLE